jgi:hypothetical protein
MTAKIKKAASNFLEKVPQFSRACDKFDKRAQEN